VDYLVFGGKGFLGSHVVSTLEHDEKNYIVSSLRLENTREIGEILDLYSPKYVINAAGLTGTPNIFWCDDHPTETIETNITYQLTMAKMCRERGIHLTVFGSGAIFENDREYGEKDRGNFTHNFYARSRIVLEDMMALYPNVLYLRINYPISSIPSPKNLLTKLVGYSTILSTLLSMTCVDDLFPILLRMVENNETGICNFVNPGAMNLVDIKRMYHDGEGVFIVSTESSTIQRSTPHLRVEQLLSYDPLPVEKAVRNIIDRYLQVDDAI
jgi:dTDP-4-dehydrorhamnose reductase